MITDLEIQTWNNKRPDTLLITVWTSQQLVIPQLAALAVRWLILPIAFLINCWKAAYSAQFNFPTRPSKASHQASYNDTQLPRHRKLSHNPSYYHRDMFSPLHTKTHCVCPKILHTCWKYVYLKINLVFFSFYWQLPYVAHHYSLQMYYMKCVLHVSVAWCAYCHYLIIK